LELLVQRLEVLGAVRVAVHILHCCIALRFAALLGGLLFRELLLVKIFLPVEQRLELGKIFRSEHVCTILEM